MLPRAVRGILCVGTEPPEEEEVGAELEVERAGTEDNSCKMAKLEGRRIMPEICPGASPRIALRSSLRKLAGSTLPMNPPSWAVTSMDFSFAMEAKSAPVCRRLRICCASDSDSTTMMRTGTVLPGVDCAKLGTGNIRQADKQKTMRVRSLANARVLTAKQIPDIKTGPAGK